MMKVAEIVPALLAFAGGTGMTSLVNFLGSRSQGKAYTMGAVDHAVQTALTSVTTELDRVNLDIKILRDQHVQCEQNLAESKQDRADLRNRINDLMTGRVAIHGERAVE